MADTDGEQVDLLTALQRSITRARTADLLVEAYRLSACPRCGGDRLRTNFTGNGGPCHAGGQGQSAVTAPPPPPECDCYPGGFTPDTYEGPQRHCRTHGDGSADAAPVVSPAEELRAAADAMSAEADRLDTLDRTASAGPWVIDTLYARDDGDVPIQTATGRHICTSPDDGVRGGHDDRDADLIACRRNTLARDAAVLRATAEMLRDSASNIDCAEADRSPDDTSEIADVHALAVARAFTEKEAGRAEYRIDFTITRRLPGEPDFTEIGFGSSGAEETIDQAAHMMSAALTHGEWETSDDMPSPESVMAEMEEADRG